MYLYKSHIYILNTIQIAYTNGLDKETNSIYIYIYIYNI